MAYSPYSLGSNSTSPPSHHSPPGPYAVKSEPVHSGLHMGGPRLTILVQPQERFRFRYESELGGTHGQLAGRSGADQRSFPTVKLDGFPQRAIIRCELYTVEEHGTNVAPVPHVHTLQGRNCSGGYAEMRVDQENDFTANFQGLGIIHTAKKQMVDKIMNRKLHERKSQEERNNPGRLWNPTEADRQEARDLASRESQRINMNRVCLRFRALFQNPATGLCEDLCAPVCSGPIFNGKSAQTGELKIVQLSDAFSPCTGNKEIWLLVERVRKNDIKVLLYEEDSNRQTIWSDYGRVVKCHHQYAIIFQTPAYRDKEIRSPVRVFIQLERPSDGCVSEPKHFQYTERDQRTPKRPLIMAEPGGASEPKRGYMDSEGGRTAFDLPDPRDIKTLVERNEMFRRQMMPRPLVHPHPQAACPPPQHPLQPFPPGGSPSYYQQPSPLGAGLPRFSPEAAASPQQIVPEATISSPPHSCNPAPSYMVSPPHVGTDPNLASVGPAHSVADVFEMAPRQLPVTVSGGPGMQVGPAGIQPMHNFGVPQPAGQESIGAEMLNDDEFNRLMEVVGTEALAEADGPMPSRNQRGPKGLLRGVGDSPAAAAAAAAADSAPAPVTRDQLAHELGRMTLGGAGGSGGASDGRRGGGSGGGRDGREGGDRTEPASRAADTSRPEVQLAYMNAESLYLFAASGDENILLERFRCLVGMENYDGDNVLHVAAMYGNTRALSVLLRVISGLPEEHRLRMVNSPNVHRQTPLHLAVLGRVAACVQLLLRAGATLGPVNRSGDTALHLAAQTGDPAVLAALLDQLKRDGDTQRMLEQTNYRGLSPLHRAVQAGRRRAVRTLCEAGAQVSAPDDTEGRSALHLAVERRDLAMCRLLIRQGAAVDAPTFGDVTPLHLACKLADPRLASLLVSHGADPSLQSVERQLAAWSGTESGDEEAEERGEEEVEDERLDAFLYAEMAGDPMLEQILRGRVQLPVEDGEDPDEDNEEEEEQGEEEDTQPQPEPQPAVAAPPPAAVAAAKKDAMDSGMDSGLGITQELSSVSELSAAGAGAAAASDAGRDCLPASAVGDLSALLDGGQWRTVATLLELDVETCQRQASPTAYILRCVKKYDISLAYLAQVLGTLNTEAQQIVLRYSRQ